MFSLQCGRVKQINRVTSSAVPCFAAVLLNLFVMYCRRSFALNAAVYLSYFPLHSYLPAALLITLCLVHN